MIDLTPYSYNPSAIPTAVMTGLSLLLGIYVLIRERGSLLSALFFLIVLSISVWFFAFSWMYCATNPSTALWWAKIAYFGVPFLPSAIYHFSVVVLYDYDRCKKMVWLSWLLSIGYSASIVEGDTLISQVYHYWWGYYPQYGWLSIPYLSFFFGMTFMALREYWMFYKKAEGTHKLRVKWLMISFSVLYLGSVDYLAKFGIPVYPFGYIPIFAFLIIVSRTIERYRLAALNPGFAADQILATMHGSVLVADLAGDIRVINRAACKMLGYQESDLIGLPMENIVESAYEMGLTPEQLLHKSAIIDQPMTWQQKNGQRVDINVSASVILDRNNFAAGVVYVAQDITERKRTEQARASAERYALAVRGARDGLWDWNIKTNEIYFSLRWKNMLGYESDEITNNPNDWFSKVHAEDIDRVKTEIAAHLGGSTLHYESEHRMLHKDGDYRWMLNRGVAVNDPYGKPIRLAGSQTDITERKMTTEQLVHQALYDPLTHLPNRALFVDLLGRAVARAKRNEDYFFAVLFLDLDRFKIINDSLGHMVGDQLLINLSRRLETCLRPGDTVARLGGDEFTILLDDVHELAEATCVASRIQEKLGVPFNLSGHEIFTTASIGIALSNMLYDRPDDLLRDADTAMYRAKAMGKARYEVFDESMHTKVMGLWELEADLRRAVEREEFQIHYQPLICLDTGKIVGVEALARWHHPRRGFVSPAEFIPIAEETGLVGWLGQWLLRTACAQTKIWHDAGHPHLRLSVNCSASQFQDESLPKLIRTILDETGMSANKLELEITESTAMKNIDFGMTTLNVLNDMGIRISIDDFGTGYSSLAYLHRFPIHTLKIDQSFISDVMSNAHNATIIRGIIAMAHSLKLKVVAEGVETREQLSLLLSEGCDEMQGYLFSGAVPPEALGKMLHEGLCLPTLIKKPAAATRH